MNISDDLENNIRKIEKIFKNSGDIIKRKFRIGNTNSFAFVVFIDNMANSTLIENSVIKPLMYSLRSTEKNTENLYEFINESILVAPDMKETNDFDSCIDAIMSGDTAVFLSKCEKAVIIASRGFAGRGVPTTETEIVVQGSKEAFAESLRTNTMLIRRRLRDPRLVIQQKVVGSSTKTDVALVYVKEIVRDDVVQQVTKKINGIKTDAIFDIGYLEQYIENDFLSPFPQCQVTERPDKAVSSLVEGRIVIIADNSPFVLIVPCVLSCFFQSPEDYYSRFEIASLTRILRYFGALIAMVLPGVYLAIALYHPNMIPTELLLKMSHARMDVPFPALFEIILMDMAFELLKEAGVRLPSAIGSTIGVVGGIIIGQAAVEAGLVSPIVVIIVALTAICGFTMPTITLNAGIRIAKYLLLFSSAFLGLLGFWIGAIIILIHLSSLKSFGFPYLYPFVSSDLNDYNDLKDTAVRPPLFWMKRRPIFAHNKKRSKINDLV